MGNWDGMPGEKRMSSVVNNISGFREFGETTNYKNNQIRRFLVSVNNAIENNKERVKTINHELIKDESQRPSLTAYCLLFNNILVYLL